MNDRFAAQLRQHLLETADDRPADGQLASVIDGVAATTQRHSLTARLTCEPGRIGPIPVRGDPLRAASSLPSRSRRAAGASMAGGARPPSSVFEGTWITIDPADGSGMTLVVGAGQTPDGVLRGRLRDRSRVSSTMPSSGSRPAAPDGSPATASWRRSPTAAVVASGPSRFAASTSTTSNDDTLSDQDDVVWTRALGERPVARRWGRPCQPRRSRPRRFAHAAPVGSSRRTRRSSPP